MNIIRKLFIIFYYLTIQAILWTRICFFLQSYQNTTINQCIRIYLSKHEFFCCLYVTESLTLLNIFTEEFILDFPITSSGQLEP